MLNTYLTDETLIDGVSESDYVSYNKLFDRYYGRLCQFAYSLTLDKQDAEDIVQELFLTLWKNREKIEIRENVSGYLFRMAKHLSLNFMRSKGHCSPMPENMEISFLSHEDDLLEAEEFRIALYDCIDRLPDRSREVLLLHRMEELKQKEISEKLSISVKTIKNLIWTSLQRLRKCMWLFMKPTYVRELPCGWYPGNRQRASR